jgi:hypothetical protein
MQPKSIITLLLFITAGTWSCSPESFYDHNSELLPIYVAKDIEVKQSGLYKTFPVTDYYVQTNRNYTLEQKIETLLQQITKRYFNDLSIELMEINTTDGVTTVYINLVENSAYKGPGTLQPYQSWFDFFQGSHGGLNTQIILTESLLQRHYQGDWIDAMVVNYQGNAFGEFDHIDLRRTIFRYD